MHSLTHVTLPIIRVTLPPPCRKHANYNLITFCKYLLGGRTAIPRYIYYIVAQSIFTLFCGFEESPVFIANQNDKEGLSLQLKSCPPSQI